jgi:hypothetical protein
VWAGPHGFRKIKKSFLPARPSLNSWQMNKDGMPPRLVWGGVREFLR